MTDQVQIVLPREQAEETLEVMERLILAAQETMRESPNIGKHFVRDVVVFTAIAEQLREKGVGEKGGMLSHPLSCRCEECEPDYA